MNAKFRWCLIEYGNSSEGNVYFGRGCVVAAVMAVVAVIVLGGGNWWWMVNVTTTYL